MSTIVLTLGGIEVQTDAQQQRVSQQLAQAQQSVRTAAEEGWIAALNPQPKTLAVFLHFSGISCYSRWFRYFISDLPRYPRSLASLGTAASPRSIGSDMSPGWRAMIGYGCQTISHTRRCSRRCAIWSEANRGHNPRLRPGTSA
jgi:hypothetical protein